MAHGRKKLYGSATVVPSPAQSVRQRRQRQRSALRAGATCNVELEQSNVQPNVFRKTPQPRPRTPPGLDHGMDEKTRAKASSHAQSMRRCYRSTWRRDVRWLRARRGRRARLQLAAQQRLVHFRHRVLVQTVPPTLLLRLPRCCGCSSRRQCEWSPGPKDVASSCGTSAG